MPPRRTGKRAAADVAEEEKDVGGVSSNEGGAPRSKANGNSVKRAKGDDDVSDADATLPPPPPPLPPNDQGDDGAPPPPLEDDDDPPPPPPSPPADDDDDANNLPPHVPSDTQRRNVADEQDDNDVGGAEYWISMAQEEEKNVPPSRRELYLDTINRTVLDFDFEKLCSVSLSNINVYACLVCGKYFQGRGPNSYAYFHAINDGHRVYMNLESAQVYVLPDNYKVDDASLNDIKYLLQPTYSETHLRRLDAPDVRDSFDLRGNAYLPGFVGLNNLGANDYMNVVVQALAHVRPLRNFFLRGGPPVPKGSDAARHTLTTRGKTIAEADALTNSTEFVRRFASLMRKIWNPRNTKAQVSPHEFYQEVASTSKGRFSITQQGDPIEFMGWLLNKLHVDLGGGGKKGKRSIVSDCFQGHVRVESQKVFVRSGVDLDGDDDIMTEQDKLDSDGRREGGQEDALGKAKFNIDREVKVDRTSFFLLAVDLPPVPVFQDVIEKNIIPQVPIADVLAKYDGVTFQEAQGLIRRFKTLKLPPFLILHYKRFTKNKFIEERNRTIVNFPVTNLSMADYVDDPSLAPVSTMYDLVANITLEATAGTVRENCAWRSQVHSFIDGKPIGTPAERQERLRQQRLAARHAERQTNDEQLDDEDDDITLTEEEKWFSIQDLLVESIDKQLLFLGETYVQIWARKA